MEIEVQSEQELGVFGRRLGESVRGGQAIELVGDVGAGKTTLVKAIAAGMGIAENVSSPSYTLSQAYDGSRGVRLVHYDFYRLNDPGILAKELAEVLAEEASVVAVEWADIVADVLPADHLRIQIVPTSEHSRRLSVSAGGEKSRQLLESMQ